MHIDRKRAVAAGLTGLLLAIIVSLCLNREFYISSMVSAYLSLALASALIVLVVIRRAWIDLLWVAAGGLILAFLDYRVLHFPPMFMAAFSFTGMAALAVLGTRTIWTDGEERKILLYGFVPSALFVASEWMASTLLEITGKIHPKTLDLFLYSFDCSLRLQFSFLMGQVFSRWLWLRFACLLVYITLPLPLALVYACQVRRDKEDAVKVILAFLATGPMGVLCYNMLPACGPVHLFGGAFPWHPFSIVEAAQLRLIPLPVLGPRNAIPSLHLTWVLLVWWNSRGLTRWVRGIALSFLVLTAMATLGTGEHYFVDLVVAFPFSLTVQAACSYRLPFEGTARRTALLFGGFTTLLWLALLSFATRIFWISPLLPWSMIAATVLPSLLLWNRLLTVSTVRQPAMAPLAVGATAESRQILRKSKSLFIFRGEQLN